MKNKALPKLNCSVEVVSNYEGKKHLGIHLSNPSDPYDGMFLVLTPAEAKWLSKIIYDAAKEYELKYTGKKLGV